MTTTDELLSFVGKIKHGAPLRETHAVDHTKEGGNTPQVNFGPIKTGPKARLDLCNELFFEELNSMLSKLDGRIERLNKKGGCLQDSLTDVEINYLAEIEMKLQIISKRIEKAWELA